VSGKISGIPSSPPTTPAKGAGQAAAAAASPASGGATAAARGADSVQITDTASYLVTAEQALNDVPVINPGRLAQVSDALSGGTYRISPERIANQLLQFEQLLPDDPTDTE
jgi:negative regulator of flagellin synthesis FlgM